MKDRLKKKLKAKKVLGNNGHSFILPPSKSKPAKKVYEMSAEYKNYLEKLAYLIDERDRFAKIIPTLPPDLQIEAMPKLRDLSEAVENLEQQMADEYEQYQKQSREIEERKNEARSKLMEKMQRIFIVAKHKFEPEKFAEFEKGVTKNMSPEDREIFYDHIAIRESYDLENILADPNGGVKRPLKHPVQQHCEAMFEFERIAYETDDDFKEMEAIFEEALADRNRAEDKLWLFMPAEREEQRQKIIELDKMTDDVKIKMIEYLKLVFAEKGKIEVKNPDQKKLDAAFEQIKLTGARYYLMMKHTQPHLFEKFVQETIEPMSPVEKAKYLEFIAKIEAEELDEILESCGVNRQKGDKL